MAIASDENIFGLQIAMDDASLVRCCQATCNLQTVIDGFVDGERSFLESFPQGLPFQEFGDEITYAVLRAHVIDGNNVWMAKRCNAARFLLETAYPLSVGPKLFRQDFDSNRTIETAVT
jgi:hypothetical protein